MSNLRAIQLSCAAVAAATLSLSSPAPAHGDVQPQPVDTTGLDPLGEEWRESNPYVGNERAIEIGKLAYGQNCARCHGLNAISGGMSPDLRYLPPGAEGDEFYMPPTRQGVVRNGMTYMPGFEGTLSQEAMWAIRSWLETQYAEE